MHELEGGAEVACLWAHNLLIPFCGHDRKHTFPNQMHKTDPLFFFNASLVGVPPSWEVLKAIRPSQQKGLRDAVNLQGSA